MKAWSFGKMGIIGIGWLRLWEEKGLKKENCGLEFGIKDFWTEMREILEKYTRFSSSTGRGSEERWVK